MFFPDKYAPKHNYEFVYHLDLLKKLEETSKKTNIHHMIFYGLPESGRRTLIMNLLENIFDPSVHNLTTGEFSVPSAGTGGKTIVLLKQSNHHIVIEPTGTNFDKHIISHVVKSYVRMLPLMVFKSSKPFKVVLINNADKLTVQAQTALRRTMEIYSKTCKFILWCTKFSSIIEPIKSRCLPIRVPVPTDQEILNVLIIVAHKEKMKLSSDEYYDIIKHSSGRIKTALWRLQIHKTTDLIGETDPNNEIDTKTTYEIIIKKIVNILKKPKLKNLDKIKEMMYEIIITNLQPTQIIISLMEHVLDLDLTEEELNNVIKFSATYEHRALIGRRIIIQLEAFIINLFNLLHNKKTQTKSNKTIKK